MSENQINSQDKIHPAERKATVKVKEVLQSFIKDYRRAASDYPKGNTAFHELVRKELGYDFRLQQGKWEKLTDDDLPRTIDLKKILAVNYFLRSNGLSTLDLVTLLTDEEILNPDITKILEKIPSAYLKEVKSEIERQIRYQEIRVYKDLEKILIDFRQDIENIIRNNESNKVNQLLDLISIIFRWYTTVFSKGRAIIFIRAKYWNGVHRKLDFDRSRTTEEFISKDLEKYQHTADSEWYFKQLEVYCAKNKQYSEKTLLSPQWTEKITTIYQEYQKGRLDLNRAKEQIFEELMKGNNWAKEPVMSSDSEPYNKELNSRHKEPSDEDKDKNFWDGLDQSLAYSAILKREKIVDNYYDKKDYLFSFLNEQYPQENETDASGYAIPILSPDRQSILGALMVVSNNPNTFTKEDYTQYKNKQEEEKYQGSEYNSEYEIIDEIANLISLCLHNIYRTSGKTYNTITTLEPNKYFPEIIFDIWYHRLLVNKYFQKIKSDEKDLLSRAIESYENQQKLYDFLGTSDDLDPLTKLMALYERAIAEHRNDINIRFAAAAINCLKLLKKKSSSVDYPKEEILGTMFEVREDIEEEGLNLAQKSFLKENNKTFPPNMMGDYLTPLYKQAEGIQKFIEYLEKIFSKENSNENEKAKSVSELESEISQFLDSIHHLKNIARNSLLYENWEKYLNNTIKEAISPDFKDLKPTKKRSELRNLIYRLHTHFHITLHMLSTMELLPYEALFSILATSTPHSIDYDHLSGGSREEHQDIIKELKLIYEGKLYEGTKLGTVAKRHVENIRKRMEESPELKKILETPIPEHWKGQI